MQGEADDVHIGLHAFYSIHTLLDCSCLSVVQATASGYPPKPAHFIEWLGSCCPVIDIESDIFAIMSCV